MLTLALALAMSASRAPAAPQADPAGPQLQLQQIQDPVRGARRPAVPDSLFVRAESLFAAGKLADARRLTERLQDRYAENPRVLVLLGRIHLAWPVIGRYTAESLFTRAARIAPGEPEPLYYLGQTGLALGGDDGEMIARRGFLPILAINPEYRDTWQRYQELYQGDNERRDLVRALEQHRGSWNADYWRGQLLSRLGAYDEAIDLLEDVVRRRPGDPGPLAWLARTQLVAGDDSAGIASYAAALELAAEDTGQVLWRQIRGIASPVERARWTATAPAARGAFLRGFWAGREPDLSTPVNERLAEHFRRMEEADRTFRLLHPNSLYFRSKMFRAYSGGVGAMPGGFDGAEVRALNAQCSARLPSVRDAALAAGMAPRMEDSTNRAMNLEDGLDDRGRVFLRHGAPDQISIGTTADETWCYFRPDGTVLMVSFVRSTGGFGVSGDMVLRYLLAGEFESAQELLATDRFSTKSDLEFAFWPAAFRAADRRNTELIVVPDSLWALAVLVDTAGYEVARDSGTGRALHLTAAPGRYRLLLDAGSGSHTGRYRGRIALPDFSGEQPVVSSLLIASGDVPARRDTLTRRAPHALTLPASAPLRVYAELYNMGRVDSVSRYRAEYRFERTDGSIVRGQRQLTIAFDREQPFQSRLIESLVIDPDRLPRGRYTLHLEIVDQVLGVAAASAEIQFRLR